MNSSEENDGNLRVTMRFDNYYRADVDIQCSNFTEVPDGERFLISHFEESYLNSRIFPKSFVSPNTGEPNCEIKGGYAIGLLLEISFMLNLRIKLVLDIGSHEFVNATKKSIDLFVGQYYLQETRGRLADPTYITGITKVSAFINHGFESNQQDILVSVFDLRLWLIFFATALFAIITIGCVSYFHSHVLKTDSSDVQDVLFEGVSVVLLQGGLDLRDASVSLHWAFIVTSLCFFCLLVAYSGAIVAMLTVPKHSIDSLQEIVNSHYSVMLDIGYNNKSSLQPILESLRRERVVESLLHKIASGTYRFESFDKSMALVRDTPATFITDHQTGIATIRGILGVDIPCTWSIISVEDISNPLSMYMGKQSVYKKRINNCLLKMDELGIMKHYRKKWAPPSESCSGDVRIIDAVKIFEVRSAYWIFLLGFNLSFVVYISEKIICWYAFSLRLR